MSDQPPKTGVARRLWELDDDDVAAIFDDESDETEGDR
jgi:hypothetical protein